MAVDPPGKPSMLLPMPRTVTGTPPLSIARHQLQRILQEAINARPQSCCGLFACADHTVSATAPIANHAPHPEDDCDMDIEDVRQQLCRWQRKGMQFCGIYHSSSATDGANAALLQKLEHTIRKAMPAASSGEIIHLFVALDTEGRLEARACCCRQGEVCEIPLVLVEDGALYPDLVNG